MKEIEKLTQRYLDGATTLQEEQRLAELTRRKPDAAAADKAMAAMLSQHVHSEEEMELWLTEDETELYDTIIRQRKQRRIIRRLTAAASVAIIICMALWFAPDRKTEQHRHVAWQAPAADYTKKQEKAVRQTYAKMYDADKTIAQRDVVTTEEPPQNTESIKPAKPKDTEQTVAKADDMTPIENIQDLIACIEAKLEEVGDSVYTAHVERTINTNRRLNTLVGKMIASGTHDKRDYPPTFENTNTVTHNF